MTLNFPNSPSSGDQFTGSNNYIYEYDGEKWVFVKLVGGDFSTGAIQDGAVTTAKLANANVTTAKILDANVTTAKIADDAVTLPKIANDLTDKLGHRNLLINGDMRVAQRGTTLSTPTNGSFILDRWINYSTKSALTIERGTASGLPGFNTSLKWTRTTGSAVGVDDYLLIAQKIEGVNSYQLDYGKANAKPITISFWVKSSVTGNYSLTIRNDTANDTPTSSTTQYNIPNTDWNYITVTIAGPGTANGDWNGFSILPGLELMFGLDVGTDYHASSADTWVTSPSKFGLATAANTWADTTGNTFEMTGVQLEMGSTATPFEHTDLTTELAKCQRYYYRNENFMYSSRYGSNNAMALVHMPVTMRDTPSSFVYTVSGMNGSFIANYINRHVCTAYHSDISYALNDIQIDAEL